MPGLIAYIPMITAVISTALSIVREKESGTMEQVRMAPIDTFSFVVGKSIPYFFISLASAALIILAAMVLFGLPMRGNWLALLIALSLFIVGALGTGLLISTVAETQQVAFQAALLIVVSADAHAVGLHLSDLEHAAGAAVHHATIVPARYFLIALRGIVLKGTPITLLLAADGRAVDLRAGDAVAGVAAAGAGEDADAAPPLPGAGRSSWSCGRTRGSSAS